MNITQFEQFWAENYSETPPINYLFKHKLAARWLRIHSLPEAKRYANTAEEWTILLDRQNTVLADLMPENGEIYLVTSLYCQDDKVFDRSHLEEIEKMTQLKFQNLAALDLFKISKDWFDEGMFLWPYIAIDNYVPHKFEAILRAIADDEMRVFFLNAKDNCIFAPYDGGVDLVFKDVATREFFEKKYENWVP
jgi:hypothetical protein